jgi:hypothetical protein
MNAATQLRQDFKSAQGFLEGTVQGVTDDQARQRAPGATHPIGVHYAHVAFSEDGIVNGMVRKGAPLFASRFAGKTGASEAPPPGPAWGDWSKSVQIEMSALREYANAVFAETDAWLATAKPEELAAQVDMGPAGQFTVSSLLGIMVGNRWMHTGEISCLKGLGGMQGYPM